MKNNNSKVIRTLSMKSMKKNRMRNVFAIVAIVLTSLLFTVTFTLTAGIMKSVEYEQMRQVGTKAHAGFKNLTTDEYNKIRKNKRIKDYSYTIFMGDADNSEFSARKMELRYAQKKSFEWTMTPLIAGHLPEEKNEIVMDSISLKALGIPAKTGEKVTLTWKLLDKSHEETFTLSGYYEGDPLAHASEAYVSRKYVDEVLSIKSIEEWHRLMETGEVNGIGLIQMDVFYRNSWHIEKDTKKVLEECGYSQNEIDYGINWGYSSVNSSKLDPTSVFLVVFVIFIIVLSGYLMIYNVFYISIVNDIRFYGLFKTIGTTKKQIVTLILRQADLLSLIGIPLGLLGGCLLGNLFLPFIINNMTSGKQAVFTANPFIFVFSVLFTFFTVRISTRKPGKIAANIAPVEAVKFNGVSKKTKIHNKNKGNRKYNNLGFSSMKMAKRNMLRTKRKSLLVMTSMALSMILFILVFTIVSSFSTSGYISQKLGGAKLTVTTASIEKYGINYDADIELTDRWNTCKANMETNEALRGMKESSLYFGVGDLALEGKPLQRYEEAYQAGKLNGYNDRDVTTKENIERTRKGEGGIQTTVFGFDYQVLKNLKVVDGKVDKEKYETGKYVVLIENGTFGNNLGTHLYDVGDTMNVKGTDYIVMATVTLPDALSTNTYFYNGLKLISRLDSVKKMANGVISYATVLDGSEEEIALADEFLSRYTEKTDNTITYISQNTLTDELNSIESIVLLTGGMLAIFIGLIAILNFANCILTGMITRKREFAMMASIGMEKYQLSRILYCENACYIGIATIASLLLGIGIGTTLIKTFCNNMDWLCYHFSILPMVFLIPLFILLGILIPYIMLKSSKHESAIELLREE